MGLFVVAWAGSVNGADSQSLNRYAFSEPHLGTVVNLTLYAPTESVANEAARSAFKRIKELDLIFSDYKPESEVRRLCAEAWMGHRVKVSRELFEALKLCLTISEQSDGAFDVTIGPLVKLWRAARKQRQLPTPKQIADAKSVVGWKFIRLNEDEQSVELLQKGMQLDFGGMAKGLIAQEVIDTLRSQGVPIALVAISGDIVAGDGPPGTDGWKVEVASLSPQSDNAASAPKRLLRIHNCAVSTSGDEFQFVEIDGLRYSHIVDPSTGKGMTVRSSVTVVAPNGSLADILDTTACLLGPDRGVRLIEQYEQADGVIIQTTDQGRVEATSKNLMSRLSWSDPLQK